MTQTTLIESARQSDGKFGEQPHSDVENGTTNTTMGNAAATVSLSLDASQREGAFAAINHAGSWLDHMQDIAEDSTDRELEHSLDEETRLIGEFQCALRASEDTPEQPLSLNSEECTGAYAAGTHAQRWLDYLNEMAEIDENEEALESIDTDSAFVFEYQSAVREAFMAAHQ